MFRALLAALLIASPAAADPVRLKILTFNIWYGGDQVSFASVIKAIQLADADIVGLQEPDGKTLAIAALAGYPYADQRRHILSKYPIFDSASGETTIADAPPYSIAGLDPDAVHAWVEVLPGQVVAVANTHLTSDPYGPDLIRDGAALSEAGLLEVVLQNELDTRMPEAQALIDGLKPLVDAGTPVILTGDFNAPSWQDWQARQPQVVWPVSKAFEDAGFTDSFRAVWPDPTHPGITWTAGRPWPHLPDTETFDRIDYVWTANMRPVESVVMGEAGNPQNALSVMPWPSDHRAVLTTVEVQPIAAPALITVEPRPVRQGDSFVLRVLSPNFAPYTAAIYPRGADSSEGALTGIAEVDPADRPTVRLSTLGLPPADYDAVLMAVDGTELARTRFAVVPEDGQASLTVTAPVTPGGDIALSFSGSQGFKLDWVGIYRAGEPSVYNYLGFAYTGARINGTLTFPAGELYEELIPGDYEARLMFDDHYRVLAVAPFTVTAP